MESGRMVVAQVEDDWAYHVPLKKGDMTEIKEALDRFIKKHKVRLVPDVRWPYLDFETYFD